VARVAAKAEGTAATVGATVVVRVEVMRVEMVAAKVGMMAAATVCSLAGQVWVLSAAVGTDPVQRVASSRLHALPSNVSHPCPLTAAKRLLGRRASRDGSGK